jgi:hypothetical protein
MRSGIAFHFAFALASAACQAGSPSNPPTESFDAGGGGPGAPCSGSSECAAPTLCAWPLDGGCSAQGHCVTVQGGCMTPEAGEPTACACDGTEIRLACIYGQGSSPEPVPSPVGPCPPMDAATNTGD